MYYYVKFDFYYFRSFYALPEYWIAVFVRFSLGIFLGINLSSIPVFIKNVTPVALLGKTVK